MTDLPNTTTATVNQASSSSPSPNHNKSSDDHTTATTTTFHQSNLRDNTNEPSLLPTSSSSTRSKKKINSAPTSVVSVKHVPRRASATIICMDDPTKLTKDNGSITTDSNLNNDDSTKSGHCQSSGSSKFPKNLSRLLPTMSRKTSQIVPSRVEEAVPLEDISVNKEVDSNKLEATSCDKTRVENGAHNVPDISANSIVRDGTSNESLEDVCRICHDNPSRMTLLSPCLCKGSMGKVHRVCLERWLGESAKTNCEICGHEYETERRPRYTGWRSVVTWIRNPLAPTDTRNLFFDLACFFILTPLAAISAWLCVVGANFVSSSRHTLNPGGTGQNSDLYSFQHDELKSSQQRNGLHHKFRTKGVEASNSTWTSIGLLTLTGTLLAAYYVWLFVAARYHIQVWREWQARNFVVTISPSNPDRIRQLREAAAAAAAAEGEVHHRSEVAPILRGVSVIAQNNNCINCHNKNISHDCSENSKNSKNHHHHHHHHPHHPHDEQQQKKVGEKTPATRTFEETSSIESTATLYTNMESAGPGPSHFSSDVDSIEGKVIVIPSEASLNVNGPMTLNTSTGTGTGTTTKNNNNVSNPQK